MTKESSIAPKERINVTFKPATGGVQEEIELPMKVMVTGDFLHRYDDRPLGDRKPVSINKNNFSGVMEKQNLSLQISVPNRLLDEGESTMSVDLSFKGLRDFEPEGIANQIPELKKLLELREALVSLKGPLGNMPAFKNAIEDVLKNEKQRTQVMAELGISKAELEQLKNTPAKAGGSKAAVDSQDAELADKDN